MFLFDFINIILAISALVYFLFGITLILRGQKNISIFSFEAVVFFSLFWTLAMFMYRGVGAEYTIFWCRFLYVAASLLAVSFFIFAYVFSSNYAIKNTIILVSTVISLLIIVLITYSNLIIKNVLIIPGQEKLIIFGSGYFIYFIYIAGCFTSGLIILLKKYFINSGIIKQQIKIIFWGFFIGSSLAMVTNLIMVWFGNFKLNWLGQVLCMFTVGFTVYAIITHRLMDIKFVMRRYSVYLASLLVIIISASIIKLLADFLSAQYILWVDLIILILAISFFPPLRDYFYRIANKYFFSSLYDSREVIESISEKLRSTLDTDVIYSHIAEILTKAFHSKALGILTLEDDNNEYSARYNTGFTVGNQMKFSGDVKLHNLFIKKNKPIIVSEILHGSYPDYIKKNATITLLKKIGVEILSPLNIKNKTIGLIALGVKESGDLYNDEDLRVLNIVGTQTAIALENALLYAETLDFNLKLSDEVKKATRDLREANEKLKKLDRAKSDFISIASHQLRTPLTVIKGYISMMLEGSFGALTKLEEESLTKVFESNERLIQLVENLLNLSRIESGRLQYNFEKHDLAKTVDSVVDELSGTAINKGLKLKYKAPAKSFPESMIDIEKIRQVVMNLIDNAIKYTKKGTVSVSLKQEGDNIEFCVSDTGMGMDQDDIPNLFKRFSRGKGTALVHTEGTGLGLYVARKMVEAHDGKIWAESPGRDQGSKFCFTMPIK